VTPSVAEIFGLWFASKVKALDPQSPSVQVATDLRLHVDDVSLGWELNLVRPYAHWPPLINLDGGF
jgi:hypothetical protein